MRLAKTRCPTGFTQMILLPQLARYLREQLKRRSCSVRQERRLIMLCYSPEHYQKRMRVEKAVAVSFKLYTGHVRPPRIYPRRSQK